MVGSARKAVVPGILQKCGPAPGNMAPTHSMTSFFQPVKIKQSKGPKLWNVMHSEDKLTWGRSY